MSLGVCLTDLVDKKAITPEHAERMRQLYDELVAKYEPTMGRAAAETMATTNAMKAIDGDFLHRKRMTLLQVKAQREIVRNARAELRPAA